MTPDGRLNLRNAWLLNLVRNVDAPITTKVIGLTIGTLADDLGTARVGVSGVAAMIGVSGLVARDHTRTLADMGLIARRWSTEDQRFYFVLTGVSRDEVSL